MGLPFQPWLKRTKCRPRQAGRSGRDVEVATRGLQAAQEELKGQVRCRRGRQREERRGERLASCRGRRGGPGGAGPGARRGNKEPPRGPRGPGGRQEGQGEGWPGKEGAGKTGRGAAKSGRGGGVQGRRLGVDGVRPGRGRGEGVRVRPERGRIGGVGWAQERGGVAGWGVPQRRGRGAARGRGGPVWLQRFYAPNQAPELSAFAEPLSEAQESPQPPRVQQEECPLLSPPFQTSQHSHSCKMSNKETATLTVMPVAPGAEQYGGSPVALDCPRVSCSFPSALGLVALGKQKQFLHGHPELKTGWWF